MDSTRIYWGDLEQRYWPTGWQSSLLDGSNEITISPSFLEINPIYDLESYPVAEQLILDDYVLNVLVPESFLDYEEKIERSFLEMFRNWPSPRLESIEQLNMPTEIIQRQLNIIHVLDDQYYFSFDHLLRPEAGNRVKDPLVIIHHGSIADNLFIPAALTHSVYFQATTHDPFGEIEPLIHKHGLQSQIQRIESVYNLSAGAIRELQAHQTRLLGLLGLLLIANLSVAYNLVANYFERSKFIIFLKSTFGWSSLKQNKIFLIIYFAYTIPLVIFASVRMGWYVALISLATVILDLITMTIFQQKLLKKSFSEIMKGER